jgi:hypothetical protein
MDISRRKILLAGALAGLGLMGGRWQARGQNTGGVSLDRRRIVRGQNPIIQAIDPTAALSIGNGTFAFTCDVTGLQTFLSEYRQQFPLCTCAQWAWHSNPLPAGVKIENLKYEEFQSHGRMVPYDTLRTGQEALYDFLRENPHRMYLGQIGLMLRDNHGIDANSADIESIGQTLDLWTGRIDSRFVYRDQPVRVQTACHPELDAVAIRIDSPLAGTESLGVRIAFAYPTPAMDMADWNAANLHETAWESKNNAANFRRQVDFDRYFVRAAWNGGTLRQAAKHEFLFGSEAGGMELVVRFAGEEIREDPPTAGSVFAASEQHWEQFWAGGAAIDLLGSSDERAGELNRRIVLSQFNTAVHCAGPMPPSEAGLLFNTWFGKSHLEMHWWHGVHFAAWNRLDLFARSLGYYQRIFHVARETAQRQGYAGARWPKMVGPEGRESPSPIGPLLIWQQPHPIYYAELLYQRGGGKKVLKDWSEIVMATADFMASFAAQEQGRYVLGPPLKSVPENTAAGVTKNPTFELAYWQFGLSVAQQWRARLGLQPDPKWQDVLAKLSALPINQGRYLMMEGMNDTYTKWNWEHPSMLGIFGMLGGEGVDREVLRRTLADVMRLWQWDRGWGWDFPLAAMTAARLHEPEMAIDALLIDSAKNHYLSNGHVYQRPNLPAYLPANGGLLAAVAMMAMTCGFPNNGKWECKAEGFRALL